MQFQMCEGKTFTKKKVSLNDFTQMAIFVEVKVSFCFANFNV